jgi:chromosome partitioning protein
VKVIAVTSIKGGVGKTTAAVMLAHLAASEGDSTLLWDLDPQGSATYILGVGRRVQGGSRRLFGSVKAGDVLEKSIVSTGFANLGLIPADFSLRAADLELAEQKRPRRAVRKLLDRVADDYDYLFMDCPPGIGLSVDSALRAADLAIVPVVPAVLPMRCYDQLTAYMAGDKRLRRVRTAAFMSMVDRRKKTHAEMSNHLPRERDDVLKAVIPNAVDIERMAQHRQPVAAYAPDSPGALAYAELWVAVRKRLEEK